MCYVIIMRLQFLIDIILQHILCISMPYMHDHDVYSSIM